MLGHVTQGFVAGNAGVVNDQIHSAKMLFNKVCDFCRRVVGGDVAGKGFAFDGAHHALKICHGRFDIQPDYHSTIPSQSFCDGSADSP